MKKTTTRAQAAANRLNAQHSSGPTTDEGKARSSQNARKKFKGADFSAVRFDNPEEIDQLVHDYTVSFKPQSPAELHAVRLLAVARFNLDRAYRLQSGILTACLNESFDGTGFLFTLHQEMHGDIDLTRTQNRNWGAAKGIDSYSRKSHGFQDVLRFCVLAERDFRHAEESLYRLIDRAEKLARRPESPYLQIEPNLSPQPEDPEALNPDQKGSQNQVNPPSPEPPPNPAEAGFQTGEGVVEGTVTDPVGPTEHIAIGLMCDNREFRVAVTDNDGHYRFSHLPVARFQLFIVNQLHISTIRYNGHIATYEEVAYIVDLDPGVTCTHDFHHK